MSVQANESFRFEQEVYFDGHLFGSTNNEYPNPGQCQIVRGSDGFYWNGTEFVATPIWNTTTVDASGLFHYYDFTIPAGAVNGDTFVLKIRLFEDPHTESLGNMIVRVAGTGGGGGDVIATFDAVDFVTGFPSTVLV